MKFPDTLYVAVDQSEPTDEPLWLAEPDPSAFAEVNEKRRVARYELVDEADVTAEVVVEGDGVDWS